MKDENRQPAADVPLAAPGLPMVVEDDELSARYDAQFVALREAARAVRKHREFVKKLCLAGKVLHRREGPKRRQRFRVHLPHLRRVLREMSIRLPGGAKSEDEALRGASSATMNRAARQMLESKPPKRGRRDG